MEKSKHDHLSIDKRIHRLAKLLKERRFISVTQGDELDQADRFILEILLRFKPGKKAGKAIEILRSRSSMRARKFKITRPSALKKTPKTSRKGG